MVSRFELEREIAAGEDPGQPLRRWLRSIRRRIHGRPALRRVYRILVGVLGGAIATLGLLLVPLPGPGWLVVFLGLAILGTEFPWARRLAAFTKRQLARFWAWWQRRRAERAGRRGSAA
ncbi:TIGR02611 family protein [Agromyces sp. ISL-38]|uniref:TIGR02611 family protein n=1 Tax=Agromyces sp. ISL-38 TaxID=2819107 RepID=UPI001BEC7889|nr:TIGR02611 family protein [Agromyces sp. ISL-38]MBT2498920.1 TIGR02611 family protein [Agromyces sp. ISL-38]MBT2516394.1 TIGR02611 family protein [Streptomyces sp. ISL-90]